MCHIGKAKKVRGFKGRERENQQNETERCTDVFENVGGRSHRQRFVARKIADKSSRKLALADSDRTRQTDDIALPYALWSYLNMEKYIYRVE
jgi:hypothetical protein